MTATILDGKTIAEGIRRSVAKEVEVRIGEGKTVPGLAMLTVGKSPVSDVYVQMKQRACNEAGIRPFIHSLSENIGQEKIESLIRELNHDPQVHGILVQLPIPSGLDEERILSAIDIRKDVDGCNPLNIGRLAQRGREPLFVSCSPAGVMRLLKIVLPSLEGLNAVVMGRSNLLGRPVSMLLLRENASVTLCHSHSNDLKSFVRQADVLVTAIGRAETVKQDWIKPGAVIIDAGINRIDDHEVKKGYRLVGDVAFDEAKEVAGAITPVPGGVGPMSIAMLLKHTLRAAILSDK